MGHLYITCKFVYTFDHSQMNYGINKFSRIIKFWIFWNYCWETIDEMVGQVSRFIAPFVCILLSSKRREIQTNRPIIGIMAQSTYNMAFKNLGRNYIPTSYVKFLESSGARVVPILNNLTEVKTKKLFESINGAVFPGGRVSVLTSGYANISRTFRKRHLTKEDISQ